MKFFIVDDDQEMIDLMTLLLAAKGHAVSSNVSGAFSLPEINKFRPDCVLTDLVMAELNGLDLCRELRAKHINPALKIIMVSARPRELWLDRARKAGADGFIAKPLDVDSFVAEVEATLRGREERSRSGSPSGKSR